MKQKKLCKAKGSKNMLEYYAELSIDAEFICKSCGRVSSIAKTLCKPKKIKDILKNKGFGLLEAS